jgi:hypothetical protein
VSADGKGLCSTACGEAQGASAVDSLRCNGCVQPVFHLNFHSLICDGSTWNEPSLHSRLKRAILLSLSLSLVSLSLPRLSHLSSVSLSLSLSLSSLSRLCSSRCFPAASRRGSLPCAHIGCFCRRVLFVWNGTADAHAQ